MRWMVVVACLVGCGSSSATSPATTLSNMPPAPPAVTEGDTLVDHLRAYRDDMCSCTGPHCARTVTDDLKHWRKRHQDQIKTHVDTAEQTRLVSELGRCETAALAKPDDDPMMATMRHFETEMCVCADHADATCAKTVTDEMSKWAVANAGDWEDGRKPTAEEMTVGQHLAECTTKAMMAGMQQQSPPPPQATP